MFQICRVVRESDIPIILTPLYDLLTQIAKKDAIHVIKSLILPQTVPKTQHPIPETS